MTTTVPSDIPFLYLSQDDLYRLGKCKLAKSLTTSGLLM